MAATAMFLGVGGLSWADHDIAPVDVVTGSWYHQRAVCDYTGIGSVDAGPSLLDLSGQVYTSTLPLGHWNFTHTTGVNDWGQVYGIPQAEQGWQLLDPSSSPISATYGADYSIWSAGVSLDGAQFHDPDGTRAYQASYPPLNISDPDTFMFQTQDYTYNSFLQHPPVPDNAQMHYGEFYTGGYYQRYCSGWDMILHQADNTTSETRENVLLYGASMEDYWGWRYLNFHEWERNGTVVARVERYPNRTAQWSGDTSPVMGLYYPDQFPEPVFMGDPAVTPDGDYYFNSLRTYNAAGVPFTLTIDYGNTPLPERIESLVLTTVTGTLSAYDFHYDINGLDRLVEHDLVNDIVTTSTFDWFENNEGIFPLGFQTDTGDPGGVYSSTIAYDDTFTTPLYDQCPVRQNLYRPGSDLPVASVDFDGILYFHLLDPWGDPVGYVGLNNYSPKFTVFCYAPDGRPAANLNLYYDLTASYGGQVDSFIIMGYDQQGFLDSALLTDPFVNPFHVLYNAHAQPDVVIDLLTAGPARRIPAVFGEDGRLTPVLERQVYSSLYYFDQLMPPTAGYFPPPPNPPADVINGFIVD